MLTIATTCPRCTERGVLHFAHADAVRGDGTQETVFRCSHCHSLSVAVLYNPFKYTFSGAGGKNGDIGAHAPNLMLRQLFPAPPKTSIPEGIDERIANAYRDGQELLLQRRWTPAASSFRTALDRATKVLWQEVEQNDKWPKELSPRIQALKGKLGLPDAIADWAHQVRIVGNEIHDLDDVTEEDARDAGHFADLFLTYTFTLPKQLTAFRQRRAAN